MFRCILEYYSTEQLNTCLMFVFEISVFRIQFSAHTKFYLQYVGDVTRFGELYMRQFMLILLHICIYWRVLESAL